MTLLANMGRDPRIESVGERSGLYKLAIVTNGTGTLEGIG